MFYKLDPDVAGHLGTDAVMDASTHPPAIYDLHYEFDGWPADDLITAYSCFIVSESMKALIENASISGCEFGPVKVSTSDQFEELQEFHPNGPLPRFHWLIITGVARRDDFGTTPTGGSLIVSEKSLRVLKAGRLDNCDIIAI